MKLRRFLIPTFLFILSFYAVAQELPPEGMKPGKRNPLFADKETAVYTNIGLSGGYSSDQERSSPQAKLKIDIAEGVFAKFSLASSLAVSISNYADDGMKKLSLSLPNFNFGYYIWNFMVYAGGGFYQCWYFKEETTNFIRTTEIVHSYGYELNAGLDYSINDYISVFFEYSFTPHRWILTTNTETQWLYPSDFNIGVNFAIPWKI